MKDFMLVFRNSLKNQEQFVNQSPEQMQAEMALWNVWMNKLAEQNKLIGGEPLLPEGKVIHGNKKKVTDGPYVEGKDVVGGYVIIKAEHFDEAVALSKDCPQLNSEDGSVEIREIMKMDQ
ncbi:MAG: hypothetical protein EBR30_26450 [Cytophagia bacterium]|nr:hypothetical protein [Cytophagia bacterium]NBW38497.1 hypothetical protein [Cytophagia bacterium]